MNGRGRRVRLTEEPGVPDQGDLARSLGLAIGGFIEEHL
jgi:hypothetical protein